MTNHPSVNKVGEHYGPGHETGEPATKHYLGIIRHHIWIVIAAVIVAGLIGAVKAHKAVPIYEAVAKIAMEGNSIPVNLLKLDEISFNPWQINYIETQIEVIKSRPVLEKTLEQPDVKDLLKAPQGTDAPRSRWQEALQKVRGVVGLRAPAPLKPLDVLRQGLQVERSSEAQILLIKVQSSDPDWARTLANAVSKAYVQYETESRAETSHNTFQVLTELRDKTEQKLREAEEVLQKAREQAKLITVDSTDQNNPILMRLNKLSGELTKAEVERINLETQFTILKEMTGPDQKAFDERLFALPAIQQDTNVQQVRADLLAAEKEIAALSETAGPENVQLRSAMAKQNKARERLRTVLTPLLSSLSVQLELLKNQEQELQKRYDAQSELAIDLAKQSVKYQKLQHEVDRQNKLYDVLLERLRDVNLTTEYTENNVKVLEPAVTPTNPVAPNKTTYVAMSALWGLMLGIALAFFFDYLDDTIKTPEELEYHLRIPVLGFVPAIASNGKTPKIFGHRASICREDPDSMAAEAYRSIRTNLFFSVPAEDNKVLTFTSCEGSDGKTTTVANLGVTIAHGGKRVLLIDADLRKPMLHEAFGIESKVGLSSILAGESKLEDAVQKIQQDGKFVENLEVLPAGPRSSKPAELLDSPTMRKLLEEARQKYDRVIIDTPPVLFIADASIVAAMSDGVILVVKSAKSTRSVGRRALGQLAAVNAQVLGGILNLLRPTRFGYYARYYYYDRYYRYHNRERESKTKDQNAEEQEESVSS